MNGRFLRVAAPALLAMAFTAGAAQAQVVVPDGSFETPATTSYVYNPTVTGVTFNTGSGVQANGSAWGFANAPDGNQTAFIQSTSNYIGQISFALSGLVVGQSYNVGFSAAARPGYASNPFTVAINSTTLGSYNVTSNTWSTFATPSFVATASIATLRFTGSATTLGDNDVGLDKVTVVTTAVPEPASWALMITGFGMVGFAMRRRSRNAVSVADA